MEEMYGHVIQGAEYDSSARDSPPRCHPGTRTQILEDIQNRINDPKSSTRVVWLHGPAGVGKSAIMQTLAETASSLHATFTTLFFSRPNKRNDPKKTFTTLAYHLAVVNSEYRSYVGKKLMDDRAFLAKSMDEQFKRLFVEPFIDRHVNPGSQRWLVFLDGLDECYGETQQCRIVGLIHDSILQHGESTPFIWVIASRPEAHLQTPFTKIRASIDFYELEVPIDSDAASRDVERYLEAEFSKIRESYLDSVPSHWPSAGDFLKVARAALGLFIFASTLIGYLQGGDPVLRLKLVLSLIKDSETRLMDLRQNPFEMLDLLYSQIMSDVPEEVLSTVKSLLGFYVIEGSSHVRGAREIPFLEACNILALERHTAYACLRKLHSVLKCPSPEEADHQRIHFLHASFSDFLITSSRSHEYHVDLNRELSQIWQCYVRIVHEYGDGGKLIYSFPVYAIKHNSNPELSHICLSWPTGAPHSSRLREMLLKRALKRWMEILLTSWYTSPDRPTGPCLSIDTPSLIEIFRKLGPNIFASTNGQVFPLQKFLGWLGNVVCVPLY